MSLYTDSLEYHARGRKGKIEVVPSKSVATQHDLSLAYSPGVAEPCRMIAEKDDQVYEYTAKGNLVAVVSNGTAVLGLGDIGPHAAKPVMEGKGILFKKFADIDVFDIELDAKDPKDVVRACEMLEPTFGGINLEDIKAPECFYIEEELKKKLKIPVFHDDQHGTAVISGAAFLNALELVGKKIENVKVVFCGGGAAAIACANLYLNLGVRIENILMTDSKGVIYKGRKEGMNPYKERYAVETKKRTLAEAMDGADAFVGVSVANTVTAAMVKSMAKDPIVFAMANPDPEILPEEILKVRSDAVIATGRSDYPNQVNNVLGFPFIFRGALDTRSTAINEEMKMAAVRALAKLAKQDVPESVSRAYSGAKFRFGKEYLIPKPFDRRVLLWVAPAVAQAAMDSGVARIKLDMPKYREKLEEHLGTIYTVMRGIKRKVQAGGDKDKKLPRIVLPEGENLKIQKAAAMMIEEGICSPILLGDEEVVRTRIREQGLEENLKNVPIIRPSSSPLRDEFAKKFFEKRARKGVTPHMARQMMRQVNYFGTMMVEEGHADSILNGMTQSYPNTLKPAMQTVGAKPGQRLAGIYMFIFKKRVLWLADTTVNIDPTAEEIADIAIETSRLARRFMVQEPKVAMLSFSNFGSHKDGRATKMSRATEIVRARAPDVAVDGEMQADTALVPELSKESFPFNTVAGDANILIFPNLESSNIAYKMLARLTSAEAIGPILIGMRKPVFVLQQNSDVNDVVNMAAIAAMEVQMRAAGLLGAGEAPTVRA
ncbi:MAG: NADP-dependent malic enzyme [Bdellovibrionales bacterium]|nr:NADP-dependent malic enzyme [Bdellovibrionales bacterium]